MDKYINNGVTRAIGTTSSGGLFPGCCRGYGGRGLRKGGRGQQVAFLRLSKVPDDVFMSDRER